MKEEEENEKGEIKLLFKTKMQTRCYQKFIFNRICTIHLHEILLNSLTYSVSTPRNFTKNCGFQTREWPNTLKSGSLLYTVCELAMIFPPSIL